MAPAIPKSLLNGGTNATNIGRCAAAKRGSRLPDRRTRRPDQPADQVYSTPFVLAVVAWPRGMERRFEVHRAYAPIGVRRGPVKRGVEGPDVQVLHPVSAIDVMQSAALTERALSNDPHTAPAVPGVRAHMSDSSVAASASSRPSWSWLMGGSDRSLSVATVTPLRAGFGCTAQCGRRTRPSVGCACR